MAKRLGPEAKIISLFTSLPDDSKRIVLDIIKSQSVAPRKASAKKLVTSAPAPKPPPVDKESRCAFFFADETPCNRIEDNPVHRKDGGYAGYHPFEPPKVVDRAGRKSKVKSEATNFTPSIEGETGNVLAASSGGD